MGLYLWPVAVAQGQCGTAVAHRAAADSQGWDTRKRIWDSALAAADPQKRVSGGDWPQDGPRNK